MRAPEPQPAAAGAEEGAVNEPSRSTSTSSAAAVPSGRSTSNSHPDGSAPGGNRTTPEIDGPVRTATRAVGRQLDVEARASFPGCHTSTAARPRGRGPTRVAVRPHVRTGRPTLRLPRSERLRRTARAPSSGRFVTASTTSTSTHAPGSKVVARTATSAGAVKASACTSMRSPPKAHLVAPPRHGVVDLEASVGVRDCGPRLWIAGLAQRLGAPLVVGLAEPDHRRARRHGPPRRRRAPAPSRRARPPPGRSRSPPRRSERRAG